MRIGQRIKQAREQRQLSVAKLSERSGISVGHIYDLEAGRESGIKGPTLIVVQSIANAMKLTTSELIGEVPPRCGRSLGCFEITRNR